MVFFFTVLCDRVSFMVLVDTVFYMVLGDRVLFESSVIGFSPGLSVRFSRYGGTFLSKGATTFWLVP